MKKFLSVIVSMLLILSLLAGCGGESSSKDQPASQPAGQSSQANETASLPSESAAADTGSTSANTGSDAPAKTEEKAPEAPAFSLEFESRAFEHTRNDEYFNGLAYATNSSDQTLCVNIKYQVIDVDGNVMSAYNRFADRYTDTFKTSLYIPAGAKDLPIGFPLSDGLGYDIKKDERMPVIDHVEYEITGSEPVEIEDIRDHFSLGDYNLNNGYMHYSIMPDQEILDNYASIYLNYTILAYENGELISLMCCDDFPYGNSSRSVAYAKEHDNGAFIAYHDVPYKKNVDKWEMYLGCISGEKN